MSFSELCNTLLPGVERGGHASVFLVRTQLLWKKGRCDKTWILVPQRIAPIPCVVKNYALSLLTEIPWTVFVPGPKHIYFSFSLQIVQEALGWFLFENNARYPSWAAAYHCSSCVCWNSCTNISWAGETWQTELGSIVALAQSDQRSAVSFIVRHYWF